MWINLLSFRATMCQVGFDFKQKFWICVVYPEPCSLYLSYRKKDRFNNNKGFIFWCEFTEENSVRNFSHFKICLRIHFWSCFGLHKSSHLPVFGDISPIHYSFLSRMWISVNILTILNRSILIYPPPVHANFRWGGTWCVHFSSAPRIVFPGEIHLNRMPNPLVI